MSDFAKHFDFKTRHSSERCCLNASLRTKTPLRQVLSGITLVLASAFIASSIGCGDGSSGPMSASEQAAYEGLKEMGALVIKDGTHPATVTMIPTEKIQGDIDKAIELVGQLPFITHLELTGLPVTDEHMQTIRGMKRINSLVLTGTQVTDAGMKTASGLPLDTLYIDKSKMTGESMQTLSRLSKLSILDISQLDLSDISPLKKLSKLEWLIMDNSDINSEAFDVVAAMPAIGRLSINGSRFAAADLQRLKSAKPSLQIDQAAPEPVAPSE